MKFCIPVGTDRDWDSPVFGHFGSAPFFAVLDTDLPHAMEIVPNGNSHHEHGQCNPVAAVAGLGINAVVVGGIGHRAAVRLGENGIAVYRCAGHTVIEVAEAIAANTLEPINLADTCQGHGEDGCRH